MPRRPKLPHMPSGDARSFSAIPRIEARVDELKARVDEHEERIDTNEDRLDDHETWIDRHKRVIAEVERDLRTLKTLGERLAERERDREHAQLVRRRRSRPRSD